MTTTLQDAIAAVRAGDMERAQLLAADIVHNNPNDPNAWYLMSQLVDSDARRAAYLSKTLSLDPAHPRATAEFAALPPGLVGDSLTRPVAGTAPMAGEIEVTEEMIHAAATRVEAAAREQQAAELAAVEVAPLAAEGIEEVVVEEAVVEEAVAAPDAAPQWLQPLGPQPVAAQKPAAQMPAVTQPTTAQRPAPAARPKPVAPAKKSNNQGLSMLLGVLGLLTILVLAVLIYLLFLS